VATVDELANALEAAPAGTPVELAVVRGVEELTLSVSIASTESGPDAA
jgi:S1-C subfamily serine protease